MQQILGKLNQDAYMIRYRGALTDTAKVSVDNLKSLISVDVRMDNVTTELKKEFYTKAEVDALLEEIRALIINTLQTNNANSVSSNEQG